MKNIKNTLVPSVTDTTDKGSERSYDIFSKLLKERIVFLTGSIHTDSISLVSAQLLHLEAEDSTRPINLYINSPGGSVYDCLSLVDIMEYISCPIYTIGSSLVASAGAVLLACGTKRFATKNCRIMIHQPWAGGIQGKVSDLVVELKEIETLKDILTDILVNKTKQSKKKIIEDTEKDKYFSSKEAKDYGLIDEILLK